jgi:transposase-like protein
MDERPSCPKCGTANPYRNRVLKSGRMQWKCRNVACKHQFCVIPERKDGPPCPDCHATGAYRHGTDKGQRRWRCVKCGRTYNATPRTTLQARLKEHLPEIVAMRRERKSYAQIGEHFGCGIETIRRLLFDAPEVKGVMAPRYLERKRLERGGEYMRRRGETIARRTVREARRTPAMSEDAKFERTPAAMMVPSAEAGKPAVRISAPVRHVDTHQIAVEPKIPFPDTSGLRQPRRLHSSRDWEARFAASLPQPRAEVEPPPEEPWPTGPVCQQPPGDCNRCGRPMPLMRREGQPCHQECRNRPLMPVGIVRVGTEARA